MRSFILILLIAFSFAAQAGKQHSLEIRVMSTYENKPLAGVNVVFDDNNNKEFVVITDKQGLATFNWTGNLKFLKVEVLDSSQTYRMVREYFYKSELKGQKIRRTIFLRKKADYSELLKEFRETDSEIDAMLNEKNMDTTVYDGSCDNYTEPEFTGGVSAMQNYINQNVRYPEEAIEENEQGRVYMKFIIEADGTISHIEIAKGVSDALDYESVRVLHNMPKWIPGRCNNQPVRTVGRMPIIFTLE